MGKRTLIAVLVALFCLCSLFANSTSSSSASSEIQHSASAPPFTVCSGTFALCTSAKCTATDRSASCLCEIRQGYSVGTKPCSDVPQPPPQPGQSIPSRYSPITSMAVCSRKVPWAMCLDSRCTINKDDPSKATCICKLVDSPRQVFVVVTDSFSASTCTSSLVSSATFHDVIQITGFLQNQPNLKPLPITIVGVDAPNPFTVDTVVSQGIGMLPTLKDGQRIKVERFDQFGKVNVERGDIVLFWFPDDPSMTYVKRIIGMPGDTVEIVEGTVIVNGRKLNEPYVDSRLNPTHRSYAPVYVRPHYYYVLGDNRDNSSDSRIWGLVPEKYIYAKVVSH